MSWKRKVAKEWLWFICTFAGALLFAIIFGETICKALYLGVEEGLLVLVVPIAFVYFIRLTVWSIKQLRKGEK